MPQLMMLLEQDMHIHSCRFSESTNVETNIFWTNPVTVKLLNSFNIISWWIVHTKLASLGYPYLRLLV